MDADRVRLHLEKATSLMVLAAAAFVLFVFAGAYLTRAPQPEIRGGLRRGRALVGLPPVEYGGASRTLILVLCSGGASCDEDAPFYRRIAGALRGSDGTRLLAVSAEDEAVSRSYLVRNRIEADDVARFDVAASGIAVTPALVMVNDRGDVLDFWTGRLTPEDERQVLDALKRE